MGWIEIFNEAQQDARSRIGGQDGQQAAPIWQTHEDSKTCIVCSTGFGIFTRRHHCRTCGAVVCNNCSTYRLPDPRTQNQERACDHCYASQQYNEQQKRRPPSSKQDRGARMSTTNPKFLKAFENVNVNSRPKTPPPLPPPLPPSARGMGGAPLPRSPPVVKPVARRPPT